MGQIDVGTPGFSIDITASEFKFDGNTLSTGIESLEINAKQEEEMTWFQGDEEAQERNAGQRSYEGSGVLGTRQFMLFMQAVSANSNGEIDYAAFKDKEFELTLFGAPKNDNKLYEFQLHKFRLLNDAINFDKSASKNKFTCSWTRMDMRIVTT